MKKIALAVLVATGLSSPGELLAVECSVPGTTLAWATDQCLLETGKTDPKSEAVVACLSKANTIPQPCEWNTHYKQKYCATLVAKRRYWGDPKYCVTDPEMIGPTVRGLASAPKRET